MHEHTVRVTTATGTVEGFTRDGVNRWRSIPYARPPVGPLRFRPATTRAVAGCAALPRVHQLCTAATPLHDHRCGQIPAHE
ncbi:carboxylesterase family protein [Mycobacterium xenopi 4042]|uniref:Carboxylesterase family protein n=1 Tax=Mycobacterium xenopi 4042 TaxID=1299334 RepID=X8BFM3_MYCXE|nr:carboxylesterase family protein [Mycobacterium xenopi 4042]